MKSFNNIEVNKNDYERYFIPVSPINLLPKTKEKFIYGELEKRHPCFSDDFYYFIRDKISKKGIVADVVVMEKTKLGSYKNKCGNGNILINGKKLRKSDNKKNVFVFIVFILAFVAIFFFGLILKHVQTQNILKTYELSENESIDEKKNYNYSYYDKDLLNNIFQIVKEKNGKIRTLKWKTTAGGEYISGRIDNLYPEIFESVVGGTKIECIKYFDYKPFFDFSLTNIFEVPLYSDSVNSVSILNRDKVRKCLLENNVHIIEENLNPYKIIFNLPFIESNDKENILIKIYESLNEIKVYISEINISSNKDFLRIELIFTSQEPYKNKSLEYFSRNLSLFYDEQKIISKITNTTQDLSGTVNNIVGEVNYKSGKKIIFYKDLDGKIKQKEVFRND